jgi:K+-transporting ATPase A subunit
MRRRLEPLARVGGRRNVMARVFSGEPIALDHGFAPIERALCRLLGVRPGRECGWRGYARAMWPPTSGTLAISTTANSTTCTQRAKVAS